MSPVRSGKKSRLNPQQYHVLRQQGTEPPFTGKYYQYDKPGMYHCADCGHALFSSVAKYDSGSGWPSFYEAVDQGAVQTRQDTNHGLVRTEVVCANCHGHLGHLFDDGPKPMHQRYCINSTALKFERFSTPGERFSTPGVE